jgi:hypothetical protein
MSRVDSRGARPLVASQAQPKRSCSLPGSDQSSGGRMLACYTTSGAPTLPTFRASSAGHCDSGRHPSQKYHSAPHIPTSEQGPLPQERQRSGCQSPARTSGLPVIYGIAVQCSVCCRTRSNRSCRRRSPAVPASVGAGLNFSCLIVIAMREAKNLRQSPDSLSNLHR